MTAAALALLQELAALGVTVRSRGPDLVLRPASALDPALRERLRAHKADLLALLAARAAPPPGDGLTRWAVLPEGADPAAPPRGWTYCRRGRLRGCWVGPDGELAAGSGRAAR